MQYVDSVCELSMQSKGIPAVYQQIEKIAKVCTRSEHTIKEGSYTKCLSRLISDNHFSPLEHGAVYLYYTENYDISVYARSPYCVVRYYHHVYYITTNYRFIVENNLQSELENHWCGLNAYTEPYLTFKTRCAIEVYKDLTRHRTISPMVESTRFCSYIKEKFGKSISFMKPCWFDEIPDWWTKSLVEAENSYFNALDKGLSAEKASYMLPQGVAAWVYFSAPLKYFEHFLDVRYNESTGPVRPDVKELTSKIYKIYNDILKDKSILLQ